MFTEASAKSVATPFTGAWGDTQLALTNVVVQSIPDLSKGSVSDADLRILAKAREFLSGPSAWNRLDDRVCEDDAERKIWSLFCALYQASVTVTGEYLHARPVMREARAALAKVTNGRGFQHPIMDYNNLESTTYADIAMLFNLTEKQLQSKKAP